jgi:DNA-directed RNA polymerase, mitochondrial
MQDRDLYLEQQELELQQADRGVASYFKSREGRLPSSGTPERQVLSRCVDKTKEAIEDLQLAAMRGDRRQGICHWGMPLLSQDAEKLAVISLNIMWNCYGQSLTSVTIAIGDALKKERWLDSLKHTDHDIWSKVKRFHHKFRGSTFYKYRDQIKGVDEEWSKQKKTWIGHVLLESVLKNSDIFYIGEGSRTAKKRRAPFILLIDPDILRHIEDSHEDLALLHPQRMPMVVPPCDWDSRYKGGYLSCTDKHTCHTPLLATNRFQRAPHRDAEDFGDNLTAVNILQKTRWAINKPILEIAKHSFCNNLELGGMLRRDPDVFPEKPQDYKYNPDAKSKWKCIARQISRYNQEMLGTRTSTLVGINVAESMLKYDQFYFVWYLDWRGRMSPRGGSLTPQGQEAFKAMLKFKRGHRLGERGYYWLTIHLANCMGVDKLPFEDRIKHVNDNKDEIMRWASDPLNYKGWSKQDSPYMCLAASLEWAAANQLANPHDFISHLPINMDGTTNGLQHLSAMCRDLVGATATNLVPTDTPNDIYAQVAQEVDKISEKDYEEWLKAGAPNVEYVRELKCPVQIAHTRKLIGSSNWIGRVDRSVCKRGTMTSPYSVTRQGVRTQLIDDGFLDFSKDDPKIDINIAADYIRDAVWEAVGRVIVNSRLVMDWLKECAGIACEEDENLSWRTPSGMLVDQGYLRPTTKQVNTYERVYSINVPSAERRLMVVKQKNAVSPNFIHSLDAAHLTNTIISLYDKGVEDMMMIHDSYGTHACHVDTLHETIRDEFVKLHEKDLLGDFKKTLETYLDGEIPEPPPLGEYDLSNMKEALYAFC